MSKIRQIPLPGLVSNLERQNLEAVNQGIQNYVYYSISANGKQQSKLIKSIPPNHMITDWFINIVEPFNGELPVLILKGSADTGTDFNIGAVSIGYFGASSFQAGVASVLGRVLTKPLNFYIVIKSQRDGGTLATTGKAYGVVTYLNLTMVEGFGRTV